MSHRNLKTVSAGLVFFMACVLSLASPASASPRRQGGAASDERGRAAAMMKQGDYPGAVEALRKVVKGDGKNDADAWHGLGSAYLALDDPDEARKAFEKALKLRPDSAAARAGLALAFLNSGRLYDAEHEARRSLGLDQRRSEGHYVLGALALRRDRFVEALERAELALRDGPDFAPALLLKARALIGNALGMPIRHVPSKDAEAPERKARLDAAAEALERALRLNRDPQAEPHLREELEAVRAYAHAYDPADPARTILMGEEVDTKADILAKPLPTYTERARARGTRGTVRVRLILGADGQVKHPLAVRGLPDGLTELSVAAARKVRFTPAVKDGRPVSTVVMLEYGFNIY